jgi:hypothetical protein
MLGVMRTTPLTARSLGGGTQLLSHLVLEKQTKCIPICMLSYGPPCAHYLDGYQDRLLGGPLGLPGLRYMESDGVEHKDCKGVVLG